MKTWYMIIDVQKCEDCNNCFLSCKDEHVNNAWPGYAAAQPLHGQRWMNIMRKERGQYPLIDVAYRPTPCMHCENAPCIQAAKNGDVYRREDGIVIIDPEKARGRKEIVNACPYGAVWWNDKEQLPQKCTFCAHLLDKGWKSPRCVQACPTGALSVVHAEASELRRMVEKEGLSVLNPALGTSPHVYYKNMYRYDKCFISGSLAFEKNEVVECAQGAKVVLKKGGEIVRTADADVFGDFKMDALDENSGEYTIEIEFNGAVSKPIFVNLTRSVSLGTVAL